MTQKMALAEFQMVRTLGVGSFGRVKYAKWKDGNFYAVKFMKKHDIIKLKQVDHINGERNLMSKIQFPFIVCMLGSFKDERYVYIVMECIGGGELFTHLRRARKFTDEQSKFYGAQTGAAFEHIHSKNIVHRDLKPENILLCGDGYSKLTDFGFAKVVEPGSRTYTLCGTPEYIAPEVLLNKGHGKPVDWWTLGILVFELMSGHPPFESAYPMQIYSKVMKGISKVPFPPKCQGPVGELVKALLKKEPSERLPMQPDGKNKTRSHKWYAGHDWEKHASQELEAPYKPVVKSKKDIANFSARKEDMPRQIEYKDDSTGWDKDFAT